MTTQLPDNARQISELSSVKQSYLNEYFGVWAIHNERFDQLVNMAQGIDLAKHVESNQNHEILAVSGGGGNSNRWPYQVARGNIAVIHVSGPMMKYRASMSNNASTVLVRRQLSHASQNDEIDSILMVFDTPGGTVSGTQDLASAIQRARESKQVFGFAEDLCASAGYWAMSQCDKVYANAKTALVGSISTFSVIYDLSKMADEKGIKVHVIRAGEFKGAAVAGTEVTDAHLEEYQRIINSMNEEFKKGVAIGRNVTIDRVNMWADGRVHTAASAQEIGLIDGIKSVNEVLDELTGRQPTQESMSKNQETTAPVAASIQELKAACPGASSDFLMGQLEAGATVTAAQTAFIAHQSQQIEQAKKDSAEAIEKAKAEAEEKAKVAATAGIEPLTTESASDGNEDHGNVVERFESMIGKMVEAGSTRQQAMVKAARKDETLYKQYLIATNKPSMAGKLQSKFER